MGLITGTILIFYLSSNILPMAIGQYSSGRSIVIDHLEFSDEDSLFDYGTVRVKKYNRTTYTVDGTMKLLQRISDEYSANLKFFAYQGNEYRLLLEKNVTNLCTFLKNDELAVKSLIGKTSWAPRIEECPLKDGDLHFYNANYENDKVPIILAQTKKLKVFTSYFFNDKVVSQFTAYVMIV